MKKFIVGARVEVVYEFEVRAKTSENAWKLAEKIISKKQKVDLNSGKIISAELSELFDVHHKE